MKKSIWLSYDFGVHGDYEGIYSWLDEHKASECGNNVAFFKYEYSGDLLESLGKEIKDSFDITKKTRIYVIWRDAETKALKKNRPLNMVDCLLMLIIKDINVNISYFATFNDKDFIDVCRKRQIEIL